jgi:outer membrane protein assembly factor BamB
MNKGSFWKSGAGIRVATLLFPPFGLVLLWLTPKRLFKKLLGTLGVLLFTLLYSAGVIWLLIRFAGLQVEWRGGYVPALTFHKTAPDYAALERHRREQPAAGTVPKTAAQPAAPYWTGFRGPNRDGVYAEAGISTNWPAAGLRRLWGQPCGGGYASFAIAEGMAFTIEQRREQEAVVAYDVTNGREVWSHSWTASFSESMGGDGPRATPAYDSGRIYALGALGELRCLDATSGQAAWSHNILSENNATEPTYGVAASPLIIGDKLIVLTSARRGNSVACYNKLDGKLLWTALDDRMGYASPALLDLPGGPQVVVSAENRTLGLQVDDGKLLWEYPWRVSNNQLPIAQPLRVSSNQFLLSAGYFTGSALVEISPEGTALAARTVWKNKNLKNKFSSSVFWRGHIYGLDEDILTCLDAQTGERKWKEGRYGYGQLLLADGCLILLTGDGELALVKATPDRHQELARFQAIHGKTWNYPAIADRKLFIRNSFEMACYDLAP